MLVDALLAAMFPGDPKRKVPGFAELGLNSNVLGSAALIQAMDRALTEVPGIEAVDVNEILRSLRKSHRDTAQAFIDAALTAYFTAPAVIRALRAGPETLFPHVRTMPDIDYTLLEPVFERGAPGGIAKRNHQEG